MRAKIITSESRIRELDGIRGIAVIMTVVWHYVTCQVRSETGTTLAYILKSTGLFWSGVDLFFVLSGFLIGGILADWGGKPGFLIVFYIRRAVRILPVYVVLLLMFFMLRSMLDHSRFGWLFDSAVPDYSYLTFTQNILMGIRGEFGSNFLASTWSLAVEEQFYLIIPLMMLMTGGRRFPVAIAALLSCAAFLRLSMPGFHAVVNMPFRMDSLLVGVALSHVFRSVSFVRVLSRNRGVLWAIFFSFMFGMAVMTVENVGRVSFEPLAISVFYGSFLSLAVIYRGTAVSSLLRARPLCFAGKYSYGIYMYHQVVSGLVHGCLFDGPPAIESFFSGVAMLIALFLTLLLSMLSFHGFEAVFLRFGQRFRYCRP